MIIWGSWFGNAGKISQIPWLVGCGYQLPCRIFILKQIHQKGKRWKSKTHLRLSQSERNFGNKWLQSSNFKPNLLSVVFELWPKLFTNIASYQFIIKNSQSIYWYFTKSIRFMKHTYLNWSAKWYDVGGTKCFIWFVLNMEIIGQNSVCSTQSVVSSQSKD